MQADFVAPLRLAHFDIVVSLPNSIIIVVRFMAMNQDDCAHHASISVPFAHDLEVSSQWLSFLRQFGFEVLQFLCSMSSVCYFSSPSHKRSDAKRAAWLIAHIPLFELHLEMTKNNLNYQFSLHEQGRHRQDFAIFL